MDDKRKKYCGSEDIGLIGVEATEANSVPIIIVDYSANDYEGSFEFAYEMVGGETPTTTPAPTTVATTPESTTKITSGYLRNIVLT